MESPSSFRMTSEQIWTSNLRRCLIQGVREAETISNDLEKLKEQEDELKLSLTLTQCVLQNSATASKSLMLASNFVSELQTKYSRIQKEIYLLKGKQAMVNAKTDHLIIKLNRVQYDDIYATGLSSYLTPISEESDADLEECEHGVFPQEANHSLAAQAHRHGHLFHDVYSTSEK